MHGARGSVTNARMAHGRDDAQPRAIASVRTPALRAMHAVPRASPRLRVLPAFGNALHVMRVPSGVCGSKSASVLTYALFSLDKTYSRALSLQVLFSNRNHDRLPSLGIADTSRHSFTIYYM